MNCIPIINRILEHKEKDIVKEFCVADCVSEIPECAVI